VKGAFTISDLTVRIVEPPTDVNRWPGENFTLTCNSSVNTTQATNTYLIPRYKNGTIFSDMNLDPVSVLQANESAWNCGTLNATVNDSCQHSWLVKTLGPAPDEIFACQVRSDIINLTSSTLYADVITLSITLNRQAYSQGEGSLATMRTNIPNAPFTVTWYNSTGSPLNLSTCKFSAKTPPKGVQSVVHT